MILSPAAHLRDCRGATDGEGDADPQDAGELRRDAAPFWPLRPPGVWGVPPEQALLEAPGFDVMGEAAEKVAVFHGDAFDTKCHVAETANVEAPTVGAGMGVTAQCDADCRVEEVS